MPRVPTTAEQRGQNIGAIGITTNVSTPFQSFTVPVFDEPAKLTGQIAKGLQDASGAVQSYVMAESKRNLSRYDADALILRSKYEEQVKAAEGQDRLNIIQGGMPLEGPGGNVTVPLQEQYMSEMKDLKAQYQNKLTSDDEIAVDLFSLKSAQSFQVFTNDQGNAAQDKVDEQLMEAKIVAASKSAVDSLTIAEESPALGMQRRNEAFNAARTAVTDGDLGQAVKMGYDPDSKDPAVKAVIEGLVQKQYGVVLTAMVDSLLADGKEEEAAALIDFETGPRGKITDETVTSTLRAKLLPYREDIKAQADFKALVASAPPGPTGTASVSYITTAIAGVSDRRKREGLESQFSKYKTVISAEMTEKLTTETLNAIRMVAKGERITSDMIPTIWFQNPLLAQTLVQGGGFANPQITEDSANQAAWESPESGGGRTFNTTVDIMMTNLQMTDPVEWLSVVKQGHLKGLINLAQDASYRKLIAITQQRVDDAREKTRAPLDSILIDIGITQKAARNRIKTSFGASLSAAINRVRTPALDAGKPVDYNDLKAAVAQELIKVRTDEGFFDFGDSYHHAASTEVAAIGVDPFDMRLDFTPQNTNYIASALGVDTPVVTNAMDKLDKTKHTLREIAKELNKTLPADPSSEVIQFNNTLNTISVEQGLPSAFIEFLLDKGEKADGSRYKRTPSELVKVTTNWEKRLPKGFTKEKVMQLWLDQHGR